jgi:hypothetical protein
MKERRYYFVGSWVLLMMGAILILFPLVPMVLFAQSINSPNASQGNWVVLIFCIVIELFLIVLMGFKSFQWIILDKNGVQARCLWKLIKKVNWNDVFEVRIERIPLSLLYDFHSQWIVFCDGTTQGTQGYFLLNKNNPVIIKHNIKSIKIVRRFWFQEVLLGGNNQQII